MSYFKTNYTTQEFWGAVAWQVHIIPGWYRGRSDSCDTRGSGRNGEMSAADDPAAICLRAEAWRGETPQPRLTPSPAPWQPSRETRSDAAGRPRSPAGCGLLADGGGHHSRRTSPASGALGCGRAVMEGRWHYLYAWLLLPATSEDRLSLGLSSLLSSSPATSAVSLPRIVRRGGSCQVHPSAVQPPLSTLHATVSWTLLRGRACSSAHFMLYMLHADPLVRFLLPNCLEHDTSFSTPSAMHKTFRLTRHPLDNRHQVHVGVKQRLSLRSHANQVKHYLIAHFSYKMWSWKNERSLCVIIHNQSWRLSIRTVWPPANYAVVPWFYFYLQA